MSYLDNGFANMSADMYFEKILNAIKTPVYVLDMSNNCLAWVNNEFTRMTGLEYLEVVGTSNFVFMISEPDPVSHKEEVRFVNVRTGKTSVVSIETSTITIGVDEFVACVAFDVSHYHEKTELALQKAQTDALTGLANRAMLQDILEHPKVLRNLSLIYLDLDGFKAVNDSHGHDAGDEVLREVGRRLAVSVRSSDIVARLGGDEFAILLRAAGPISDQRVRDLCQNLCDVVSKPIDWQISALHVSASVGVAHIDPDLSPAEIIKRADQAMYTAKRAGKNQFYVYDQR